MKINLNSRKHGCGVQEADHHVPSLGDADFTLMQTALIEPGREDKVAYSLSGDRLVESDFGAADS